MELDPHLAYSIRSRGERIGCGVKVCVGGGEGGLQLTDQAFFLFLPLSVFFLAGGELAVVAFREGCGHHGMLLCLLHCQLHGPELRQAQAAAAAGGEALAGQDGVKAS